MKKICSFLMVLLLLAACLMMSGCGGGDYGIVAEYDVIAPKGSNVQASDLLDGTISVISIRLSDAGYKDAKVQRAGPEKIRVVVPVKLEGQEQSAGILALITSQGQLEFKDPEGNTFMTGEMVKSASYYYSEGDHQIAFELTDEGKEIFADMTSKSVGKIIAVYLDGEELIAPTVQSAITDGRGVINNLGSAERATRIATLIQSGALPVELKQTSLKITYP